MIGVLTIALFCVVVLAIVMKWGPLLLGKHTGRVLSWAVVGFLLGLLVDLCTQPHSNAD